MPEIIAVIGSEERDAVRLELVGRVLGCLDRSDHVREAGQRPEEAEFLPLRGAEGHGVTVPFAGEGAAGFGVALWRGRPAISAPGAERERTEVEIERLLMKVEEASRLQGRPGAPDASPGGGEGAAVGFRTSKEVVARFGLPSKPAAYSVFRGRRHYARRHCPGSTLLRRELVTSSTAGIGARAGGGMGFKSSKGGAKISANSFMNCKLNKNAWQS